MRTVSSFSALRGISPLCVLLTSGCLSTVVCPEGTRAVMGACVGDDAGVPDGGADDAMPTDAFVDDASAPTDGGIPVDAPTDARGVDAPSDACTLLPFFADADEDGFGDESAVMMGCVAPAGFIAEGGDCDDANDLVNPMATEACDMAMVDEDCDGMMNEGCECYVGQTRGCPGESDVGECVAGTQTCDATGHWGVCTGNVRPMTERCDSRDNNCDGTTDEDPAADASCGTVVNGSSACVMGACQTTCTSGFADCSAASGCETTLGSISNCTACGAACGWSCRSAGAGCNDVLSMSLSVNLGFSPQTSCAIRADRTLACWGDNDDGETGIGRTGDIARATAVPGLASNVIDSAAGPRHSCAVTSSTSGATSGQVYCWGDNTVGQLGTGTADSLVPVRAGVLNSIVEVVAGYNFSCARNTSGAVFCWGENGAGQLGQSDTTDRTAPIAVMGVSGAVALEAGFNRVCAAVPTGVVCWGEGHSGRQLFTLPSGLTAVQVGVGTGHTCAVANTGALYCWGENSDGQVGNASTTNVAAPTRIGSYGTGLPAVGVTDLALGSNHTCVRTSDSRVACWGANASGQLGDGTVSSRTSPTMLSLSGVLDVEAGDTHTCALTRNAGDATTAARVWCWGSNAGGELGDGSTMGRLSPVSVTAP